mmetsp:Transcript_24584/g.92911  ORF Transcript_24584/g.92911 Transcript_24584/m.92911 type:complete len:275 (-) Transcript_24584:235-1059(-)
MPGTSGEWGGCHSSLTHLATASASLGAKRVDQRPCEPSNAASDCSVPGLTSHTAGGSRSGNGWPDAPLAGSSISAATTWARRACRTVGTARASDSACITLGMVPQPARTAARARSARSNAGTLPASKAADGRSRKRQRTPPDLISALPSNVAFASDASASWCRRAASSRQADAHTGRSCLRPATGHPLSTQQRRKARSVAICAAPNTPTLTGCRRRWPVRARQRPDTTDAAAVATRSAPPKAPTRTAEATRLRASRCMRSCGRRRSRCRVRASP